MIFKSIYTYKYFLIYLLLFPLTGRSQTFKVNGGAMARVSFVLGNQNQKIEAGLSAIGTTNYGDASLEIGAHFDLGQLFKRHTIKQRGIFYGYDFYALGGIGKNSNLLGSTISGIEPGLIFDTEGDTGFNGLGFGFQKEFFPGDLSHFSIRRGKLLTRFSNANHSIDVTFMNDFKFAPLFDGEGSDFGTTGNLRIGFTQISGNSEIFRVGVALDLFTPKPDYTRTPNNPINSDDGRKNSWYTTEPYSDTFYANLYAFGTYQNEHYNAFAKAGINSQKLGAYIQNTLHDGFGLNPRFPWDVLAEDKLFVELGSSLLKTNSL